MVRAPKRIVGGEAIIGRRSIRVHGFRTRGRTWIIEARGTVGNPAVCYPKGDVVFEIGRIDDLRLLVGWTERERPVVADRMAILQRGVEIILILVVVLEARRALGNIGCDLERLQLVRHQEVDEIAVIGELDAQILIRIACVIVG